jgi:hypothetical protein
MIFGKDENLVEAVVRLITADAFEKLLTPGGVRVGVEAG